MTAHAIAQAVERGARRVVLSATAMAEPMYRDLGFSPAGVLGYWLDPALGA